MTERGAWGPLLRQYRLRSGRTQSAVAHQARIVPATLTTYELGLARPSHGTAAAICSACDCTPEEAAGVLEALDAAKHQETGRETVQLIQTLGPDALNGGTTKPAAKRKRDKPRQRAELIRCEECGMALNIAVRRLGEVGYAETVLLRAAAFAREHTQHGEVVVQRLVWPRTTCKAASA